MGEQNPDTPANKMDDSDSDDDDDDPPGLLTLCGFDNDVDGRYRLHRNQINEHATWKLSNARKTNASSDVNSEDESVARYHTFDDHEGKWPHKEMVWGKLDDEQNFVELEAADLTNPDSDDEDEEEEEEEEEASGEDEADGGGAAAISVNSGDSDG